MLIRFCFRGRICVLWARPERRDFLHRQPTEPVRLTNGPMSLYLPIISKDQKHIFDSRRATSRRTDVLQQGKRQVSAVSEWHLGGPGGVLS